MGLARRKERLDILVQEFSDKPGKFHGITADVTVEDNIIRAFQWVKDNLGPVHILINNAGVLQNTTLIDGDTSIWKQTFDTNVMALCIATREAIRDMKLNSVDGHIIHINSVSGHRITYFPQINVYAATKHAVTALTETLRIELNTHESKIKVTVRKDM